ncbi:hypothetical protein THRCLA_21225 [Thraustotheca clavata]|uniref:Uncharacterized protein n=1 Tax=Thraustotheca clavata TaxID=74557 RepID=A0A1V9ZYS1_9STRA|nr:hypothetical protein THRCLA_21225 [Thraustotheca clavata]
MFTTIFVKAGDGTIDTDIKRGNWVQMRSHLIHPNEVTKETRWEHPMDPHEQNTSSSKFESSSRKNA